jgi:SAM-dependent methyltransferase
MVKLYRDSGLDIYEKAHYSHGEHIREVEQMLTWYLRRNTRVLDIGCSGGLHALEFAWRGFAVTGVDIEPSAIQRAKERSRDQGLDVEFLVIDLEKDDITCLGKFDFIYSIGNVMSHVRKDLLGNVFRKIRACLKNEGIFLFDLFIIEAPFQEEVFENDLKIIWHRSLDGQTGSIHMDGNFQDFGITQHFEVWGYSIGEVCRIANLSGFHEVDFSDTLDFSSSRTEKKNPVCLNFRTRIVEGIDFAHLLAGDSAK